MAYMYVPRYLVILWSLSLTQALYKGYRVGEFQPQAHGLRGTIYILDCNRLLIENFGLDVDTTYADTEFVAQYRDGNPSGKEDGSGLLLNYEFDDMNTLLKTYGGSDFTLQIFHTESTWSLNLLYVYSYSKNQTLGSLTFPLDIKVPASRDIGELTSNSHGVSGRVTVLSDRDLYITDLYYDGTGPDAYFYVGNTSEPDAFGTKVVLDENLSDSGGTGNETVGLGIFTNYYLCLTLPGNMTIFDISYVSIFSKFENETYGNISIPSSIRTKVELVPAFEYQGACNDFCVDYQIDSGNAKFEHKGVKVGTFHRLKHGLSGDVYVAGCSLLVLSGFSLLNHPRFTGFWINERNTSPDQDGSGYRVVYETDYYEGLMTYSKADLILPLPDGHYVTDIGVMYIWNYVEKESYGMIKFPQTFEVPTAEVVGNLENVSNNISGRVLILNEKTLFVKRFTFDGKVSDAYFYVGKGIQPDKTGFKLTTEHVEAYYYDYNSTFDSDSLRAYQGESLCLKLPETLSAFHLEYLAVYSPSLDKDMGSISIVTPSTIPPDLAGFQGCTMEDAACLGLYFDYGMLHPEPDYYDDPTWAPPTDDLADLKDSKTKAMRAAQIMTWVITVIGLLVFN